MKVAARYESSKSARRQLRHLHRGVAPLEDSLGRDFSRRPLPRETSSAVAEAKRFPSRKPSALPRLRRKGVSDGEDCRRTTMTVMGAILISAWSARRRAG